MTDNLHDPPLGADQGNVLWAWVLYLFSQTVLVAVAEQSGDYVAIVDQGIQVEAERQLDQNTSSYKSSPEGEMDRVTVRVKRLDNNPDLPLPTYQSEGSSGLDLRAAVDGEITLQPGEIQLIRTGLSISLPPGYEAQVRPRSGLALQYGLGLVNSPGTIDSDYRGEIGVIAINWGKRQVTVKRGDRIGQIVITKVSRAIIEEVVELDCTKRGDGGFGHSGV